MNPENSRTRGASKERNILSVSQLNRQVRQAMETAFPMVWIEGEISNLVQHSSGHWYFSLKDENCQVRCAMFKGQNQLVRIQPANGDRVLVRARVSLYPERGEFQLIVQHMENAGEGALFRAFEQLRQKLLKEGLFDEKRKKALPAFPKHIGIISSPEGSVIHDIHAVLQRRCPLIEITLFPALVQGSEAPQQIIRQLERIETFDTLEAVIIARGGGSMEDLQPFNEESVARAIARCSLPVVSSIGHETDTTIADFVADQRAPTPSVAAEMLSPDQNEWLKSLSRMHALLHQLMTQWFERKHDLLSRLSKSLKHPDDYLREKMQHLDHLDTRLQRLAGNVVTNQQHNLEKLSLRLQRTPPSEKISKAFTQCQHLTRNLDAAIKMSLYRSQQKIRFLCGKLETCSPLQTLARGYSIVHDKDGNIVRSYTQVNAEDSVQVTLHRGSLHCKVQSAEPEPPNPSETS